MKPLWLWASFCLLLLLGFVFHPIRDWNREQLSIYFDHTSFILTELVLVLVFAGAVLWAVRAAQVAGLNVGEYAVLVVIGIVVLFGFCSTDLGYLLPSTPGTRSLISDPPRPFSSPGLAGAVWLLSGVSGLIDLLRARRSGGAREAG